VRVLENISELFGMQGMEIEQIVEEDDLSVTLHLGRSEDAQWSCPACHSLNVICYDHAPERQIRDLPIWDRVCRLAFRPARVKCRQCGAVSTERLSWMEANQHQTLRFERRLVLLCEKMTAKEASEFERIDRDAAYRIERRWLERSEAGWTPEAVSKLGIDEIAIRKGHNYATVFYDLSKREVVGMVEGRKAADCSKFLKGWDKERRGKVEAVCMDMWDGYHKSVSKLCPDAAIVFDKFHISKYFHNALDKVRQHEQAFASNEDGKMLKGTRWLWHKPELSPKQKRTLRSIMAVNKPLFKAYLMVEDFEMLYKCESIEAAACYLKDVIRRFRCSHLEPFKKLGLSLKSWRDGILNYFKHSVSNAAAEGLNNKIKVIKRRSYGFREFEYFRLKVLQCAGSLPSVANAYPL
jgi:transposase